MADETPKPTKRPKRTAKDLIAAFEAHVSARSNWTDLWDDCGRYCIPEFGPIQGTTAPGHRHPVPLDATGMKGARILSSGIHANTWGGDDPFTLRTPGPEDEAGSEEQEYLNDLARWGIEVLQNSTFPNRYAEGLRLLTVFGTLAIFAEWTEGAESPHFLPFAPHQFVFDENSRGEIVEFAREFDLTAGEAEELFGADALHSSIAGDARNEGTRGKKHKFIHFIYRRTGNDGTKRDVLNMPWASCWLDRQNCVEVKESGYRHLPVFIVRYERGQYEKYGRSPAMEALPDMRTANRRMELLFHNQEMQTFPPLVVDNDDRIKTKEIKPGAVIRVNTSGGFQPFFLQVASAGFAESAAQLATDRENILGAFHADLFALFQQQSDADTATEVVTRDRERIQLIAPIVTRINAEFWNPFITWLIARGIELGRAPLPPESFGDRLAFKVQYTTRFDAKLARVEVDAIRRTVAEVAETGMLLSQNQDLAIMVDFEKTARTIATANGVGRKLIRSQEEVAKLREARDEAEAAAQAGAAAREMVKPVDPLKKPEAGSMMGAA